MSAALHQAASPTVLIVTEIDDPTADQVIAELNRRGRVRVVRIDPGDFPHEISIAAVLNADPVDSAGSWHGRLVTPTRNVDLRTVAAVYWRRPTPYQFEGLSERDAEFAAAQARIGFGGVLASLPRARVCESSSPQLGRGIQACSARRCG